MSKYEPQVATVTGPIAPSELGPTLMHEHVLVDFTPPYRRDEPDAEINLENVWELNYNWVDAPGLRRLTDVEVAVREMRKLREAGGRSVVEVSTPGMVIDPLGLQSVSDRSGVQIVMGCGRYLEEFMSPTDQERSVDDLMHEFLGCLRDGFPGTDIKAGLIGEIGCSSPLTEPERRSVVAAALAQKETGAAISIHPGRSRESPFDIVEILRENGADLTRTVMCHIERRIFETEDVLRLAETGVTVEYDLFGWETSYFAQGEDVLMSSDTARIAWIRALIDAGHRDQIVISQDICQKTRQSEYGGHGYGHIFRNVLPMMRKAGFSDDEIDRIVVGTPARLLAN